MKNADLQLVKDVISSVRENVLEGNASALESFARLKHLAEHLASAMEDIKQDAITEAKKYEHGRVVFGYSVTINQNAGARWDYKHIPEWATQSEKLKQIEDCAKAGYRNLEKIGTSVTDDGEVVVPAKYKPGGETLVLSKSRA